MAQNNKRRQLSRNHGWLFKLTWPITHYLITHIAVISGWIYFRIFNRTTIIGKRNVPRETNTLLLSNHQSMIDSFLVGMFAFLPFSLIKPKVIPWNPAAEENFYRNSFLGWVADNWKCIPVKKGRKDVSAIYKMADALKMGTLILFPEGTRSRDGSIGKPRGGAGMVVLETQPTVIPVCIDGMDKVLPIGSIFPRFFKRIYISYGEPLDLSEFYDKETTKEVAHDIMERVMEIIREMHGDIQTRKAKGKMYSKKKLVSDKKIKSKKIKSPKTA